MANEFSPATCAVCGASPTVKSHIVPRALAHDLRGEATHLVMGTADQIGIKFKQSGNWNDRILCAAHEGALTQYDDYGIAFVREASNRSSTVPHKENVLVPNVDPTRLLNFYLSMIWKKNLSHKANDVPCKLGPYGGRIENALLSSEQFSPPLLLVRSPTSLDGEKIPMINEPHPTRLKNLNAWKCEIGDLTGIVVLDNQGLPKDYRPFDASRNQEATVFGLGLIDLRNQPSLHPILSNMQRSR